MTKRNLFLAILLVTTTAVISIAAVLLWSRSRSQPSSASQTSSAPVNSSGAVAQLKSHAPGAAKEGIKVHGNWTIEIRNPDGKLVERREFKNALLEIGALTLGKLLRRESKIGEWQIDLDAYPDTNDPCHDANNTPCDCIIYETGSQRGPTTGYIFSTLTISSVGGVLENKTVFSGNATAQRNGSIRRVSTRNANCLFDSQGVCFSNSAVFTSTSLPNAINVVEGQIIQVTVVISFS